MISFSHLFPSNKNMKYQSMMDSKKQEKSQVDKKDDPLSDRPRWYLVSDEVIKEVNESVDQEIFDKIAEDALEE